MDHCLVTTSLIAMLSPLAGGLFAGIGGGLLGRTGSHRITILGVAVSLVCAVLMAKWMFLDNAQTVNAHLYTWLSSGGVTVSVGLLVDHLSVMMLLTVTFVSLLVHIYSIGYMADDAGYQRFFCYMSLFTFSMLALVLANNFIQLFFGWEGVGVVSYLLIGFYFKKPSASSGSLKAFLVNRVGDFGLILGIALLLAYGGSLDYAPTLAKAHDLQMTLFWPSCHVSVATLACGLLLIGAMGKSAQIPLHVWLPESMEGPTPISALIHAATMVTAGVYMISRMSPLYELAPAIGSTIMVIGSTGALFLGLVGIVQNDIKRVIAYSTLSQLGYMVAATGASAYGAGMFHLFTHAAFKALLFLGAGSVIIAMHHEQDMRKMGGLRRYMPITYATYLIGTLALTAFPPFSGFYSKDSIISAVKMSTLPGAGYAYVCLVLGAFVTAVYSFRGLMLTFHGQYRGEHAHYLKESPWTVTIPLVLLAIPSVILGFYLAVPILSPDGLLADALYYLPGAKTHLLEIAQTYRELSTPFVDMFRSLPFWMSMAGTVITILAYSCYPQLPQWCDRKLSWIKCILCQKFGFDQLYQAVFVCGTLSLSSVLSRVGDRLLIDRILVGGTAGIVSCLGAIMRRAQTGFLYHYIFVLLLALAAMLLITV